MRPTPHGPGGRRLWVFLSAALVLLMPTIVAADTIANPVAAFSGLDKITGRITKFDVYIDETVQFGALQITPRVCYTRPPTETQRTSVFVEVDQVSLKGQISRIFTGWMFADSPALNAVDHAVYDIWLDDCKQSSDVPPPETTSPPATPETAAPDGTQALTDDRG
ncbi:MAG TPA: DUF2155 domain-containing protein [Alphaproteobacteria bacterium]|nr:DUF2155 domain-containing protein [Alphaproteobacteria bacterium]